MRSIPYVHKHGHKASPLEGTARFEAFSDGVFAILITLLIFEVHIPLIKGLNNQQLFAEIVHVLPQLGTFAISFIVIAIFWVNHYHFTHNLTHTDYKLLWKNNILLFWLALVPFTTSFLGQNPTQPVALMAYSFVLFMGAFSFRMMSKYAYLRSTLMDSAVSDKMRQFILKRSMIGVVLYAIATLIAPITVYASIAILLIVPLAYFAPITMGQEV